MNERHKGMVAEVERAARLEAMAYSKSVRQVSTHCSTKKSDAAKVRPVDPESLVRFAETLKLRSLVRSTQEKFRASCAN